MGKITESYSLNRSGPGTNAGRRRMSLGSSVLLLIALLLSLFASTTGGLAADGATVPSAPTATYVGVYVLDIHDFDVENGEVQVTFYLSIRSEANVSIDDLEIMNGQATSVVTMHDGDGDKEYRVSALVTVEPDLRRFPFDRHVIAVSLEPKLRNESEMTLVVDADQSGIDPDEHMPGWSFTGSSASVTNKAYLANESPYSRAVFEYSIERDSTSTVLKFFLPIALIIVVALSSLMIKISSRLGLNASLFLAAVLIHWRVADAIPAVAYATFLDTFMIITYATLVMVLVSGIVDLKHAEVKDMERVQTIYRWSVRTIPALSVTLYSILFLSLAL